MQKLNYKHTKRIDCLSVILKYAQSTYLKANR